MGRVIIVKIIIGPPVPVAPSIGLLTPKIKAVEMRLVMTALVIVIVEVLVAIVSIRAVMVVSTIGWYGAIPVDVFALSIRILQLI